MKQRLAGILYVSILLVALFLAYGEFGYCKNVRGVTKDTVKIGVIIDLTGPTSNVGVVVNEAYKNYIRNINDAGGIHGRKIKMIIEDDHYAIPAGIAAFKKLLFRDQVLALMGPISVGEIKVLFRHIKKNKIPTLPWAPDKSVMTPYKRYIFPTNGIYSNEFGIIFQLIINNHKKNKLKMAFCYPDVESGKLLRDAAVNWSKFFGFKLHLEVLPMSAIDVTSQVLNMKRAGITHVVIGHVAPGVAAVLKDMKKFALNIPSFGLSAGCTEDVIRIAGDASANYISASQYSSWYEDYPGVKEMRRISKKYNPDADKSFRIKSYSIGWVIPKIMCTGIKIAGNNLTNETLVTALETFKNFDTKGICGPITYTSSIHYGLSYIKLFKTDVAKCELIPITEWSLPPTKKISSRE